MNCNETYDKTLLGKIEKLGQDDVYEIVFKLNASIQNIHQISYHSKIFKLDYLVTWKKYIQMKMLHELKVNLNQRACHKVCLEFNPLIEWNFFQV